ncbi:MAG: exosortase/archaeosortase family protein [Candidatus Omnitrophica bacterium]|nr:exosortase/archaeosortase family protein [Candidatus Omnitrophota bacterium]MBI2174540.1 exosortase/archaeosortase family protein [Candidatus Omnitrophota bacterium]MBI3010826.1 exosortase/archaeosortase family protein [Candidatus Omnitrophota bacterium]
MNVSSGLGIRPLAWTAAFLGILAVLFWPTFTWMAERFEAHDSFYSHGWLIPFASGWLIWQRRKQLAAIPKQPTFSGLLLLVPSLTVYLVTSWIQVHFMAAFALLGVLWGLVWVLWGWPVFRALRFPLLFLLFMVPLPGILLIAISFKMKMAAASLATHILPWLGIPALQAGSTIHVPGISVVVDDTCSGLRSLISLIALAVLWTTMLPSHAKSWQRICLVVSSIPIALATNMVRILVLVLLSAIYGPKIAEGFIHYGSGIVVFGLALLLLAGLSRQLVKPHSMRELAQ